MRTQFSWIRLMAILAICLPMAAGCGSDGDDNATPSTEVPAIMVQSQAVETLGFIDGVVASIEPIANGDFGSLPEPVLRMAGQDPTSIAMAAVEFGQPTYTEGTWTVTYTFSDEMGDYSVVYAVQFLDGSGAPQIEPDEATTAVNYDIDMDVALTLIDENGTTDVDFTYSAAMGIDNLPAGPYGLEGAGQMAGTVSGVSTQGSTFHYANDMGWSIDVSVPAGGCPTGSASMNSGGYTFNATYTGGSEVPWQFLQNGNVTASGTHVSGCGSAPAK